MCVISLGSTPLSPSFLGSLSIIWSARWSLFLPHPPLISSSLYLTRYLVYGFFSHPSPVFSISYHLYFLFSHYLYPFPSCLCTSTTFNLTCCVFSITSEVNARTFVSTISRAGPLSISPKGTGQSRTRRTIVCSKN